MSLCTIIFSTLILLSATPVKAQMSGLRGEITRFVNQIDEASGAVGDAMASFTAEFSSGAAIVSDRSYSFSGSDIAKKQNPISSIRYGYVDDHSNFFVASGSDNVGMYALEVTFKTPTDYPDIHPSLSGKTVLFIAHGPGPSYRTIFTTDNTAGTANLADYDSMSRISGFSCHLKSQRCDAAQGSLPSKTCSGTNLTINNGEAPGMIVNNTNNINLFYYVHGPFSLCADQFALRNSMGG